MYRPYVCKRSDPIGCEFMPLALTLNDRDGSVTSAESGVFH